jgi:hypothetical protein
MKEMLRPILFAAAAGTLLAGCVQPPPLVQALPPGPDPCGSDRLLHSAGVGPCREGLGQQRHSVMHAENTFLSISQEILSRQDPRLFDAWEACERYRVAGPRDPRDVRSTFDPQFARDCESVDRRYNLATSAIRRDLEARIGATDLAIVAQAGTGQP